MTTEFNKAMPTIEQGDAVAWQYRGIGTEE